MDQGNNRSLEEELAWFCGLLKNLKRSVRETQQYFRDLNISAGRQNLTFSTFTITPHTNELVFL